MGLRRVRTVFPEMSLISVPRLSRGVQFKLHIAGTLAPHVQVSEGIAFDLNKILEIIQIQPQFNHNQR